MNPLSLVPRAGHERRVVGRLHPPHGLDGGAVLGHLHRLVGRQVPALDLLVARGHEHLGAVVMPAAVQNWTLEEEEKKSSSRIDTSYTGQLDMIAHRKWRETKQRSSRGHQIRC